MSLVGNTIFIILFFLMPGFFFWHFFLFGLATRTQTWVAQENPIRSLIRYLCITIPIHMVLFIIMKIFGYSYDFKKIFCVFVGYFEQKGIEVIEIGNNIADNFIEIFLYWLIAILIGSLFGLILNKIIVKYQLYFNGYLKLKNAWFYRFFNTDLKSDKDIYFRNFQKPPPPTYSNIHILTMGGNGEIILYQGYLYDYTVNRDGELENIVLMEPFRDYGGHNSREWHKLNEDYLVLNSKVIINITIQGLYGIKIENIEKTIKISDRGIGHIKIKKSIFDKLNKDAISLSLASKIIPSQFYNGIWEKRKFIVEFKTNQKKYFNKSITVTLQKEYPMPPKVL